MFYYLNPFNYYHWLFGVITNGNDWYTAFALAMLLMHVVLAVATFGIVYGVTKWDGYAVEHFNEWRSAREQRIAEGPEGYRYKSLWYSENLQVRKFFRSVVFWLVILASPFSGLALLGFVVVKFAWNAVKSLTLIPQMIESYKGE